jgi:hypothetical protein
MYEEVRTLIEVISAIMCFILLRFLIKPYRITGESRYIGLPLGFGFLGVTYAISAFAFYEPRIFGPNTIYFQLIARTFAFIFIAITYFFSKKSTKNSTLTWKVALTLLVAVLIISFLIISIPDITLPDYRITRNYFRVLDLTIILYICIHTFRSHIEKPDQKTIWIPLSFIILLVSQYSVFLFQLDGSISALFAGLILRLVFLSILLFVSFRTFYHTEKEVQK